VPAHSISSSADNILQCLSSALNRRDGFFEPRHDTAFRLFSGFYEGYPDLVIDLYGRTLVIYDNSENPSSYNPHIQNVYKFYFEQLSWLRAVILKAHKSANPDSRRGIFLYGDSFDRHITENHVRYSIDLLLNQDASFYLDTRNLRIWAKNNLRGMSVLNTFSYTGSLGVAARAGNSRKVVHLDRYRKFLDIARTSYVLNGFPVKKSDFITGDFWRVTSQLRHSRELFDCVIVDPPVYAQSNTGIVDLVSESSRVINKVRPIVGHDGYLVVVNNALFLSGADFMQALTDLCASGYMQFETAIPVPEDIAVTAQGRTQAAPVDPAPFNHSTKIAILRVQRKDGHRA